MNLPGFTAQGSLYRASGHYRTGRPHGQANGMLRPAAIDLDRYNTCINEGGDAQFCRSQSCYEEVTCDPDPAYPYGSPCQICYRDFCPGPGGTSWYTCDNPPPPPPLQAPCYLDGLETSCDLVQECLHSGACQTVH